jgi:hypothetical protein
MTSLRAASIVGLLVATGCGDGSSPREDDHFIGRWAGAPWAGDAEAIFVSGTSGTDTLYIFGIRPIVPDPYPEEILRVRVPFSGPGVYQLPGDAIEYAVLTGGDVYAGQYAGQDPVAGTLTVDAYDPATGSMAGTVEFDAVAASVLRPYGDAARFENGRFELRVDRRP